METFTSGFLSTSGGGFQGRLDSAAVLTLRLNSGHGSRLIAGVCLMSSEFSRHWRWTGFIRHYHLQPRCSSGLAYYSFCLTYDRHSDFAFAVVGQRDIAPRMHRIRMLALEGKIYKTDSEQPEFGLTGRLDFSFVAAFVATLMVIQLLHDLRASERLHGRLAGFPLVFRPGKLPDAACR